MSADIDLNHRPKTYFRPLKLENYLLSKVKGAVMRKKLAALFEAGRHDEARHLLADAAFSEADRKMLESIHPMFMGGNYLPDTEDGEIEIARISIRSTTSDVTSVYARLEDGVIHYRVADEYGGDTLQGRAETTTTAPMTLGELADFFLTAWPLIALLEMNFEDDLNGALRFFSADSEFYPDFDRLCRQRVREHFPEPAIGDECPFCGHFNSPPRTDDHCEHAVAWDRDGEVEPLASGEVFVAALQDLADLVDSAAEGSALQAMLEAQARRSPKRQELIDCACLPLEDALETLASAEAGEGWSTSGPVGSSGHTLCVSDPSDLDHLASECRAILAACAFEIRTKADAGAPLEARRPDSRTEWKLVASGFWHEDVYHSGHVAYHLANPQPGGWVMEARERTAVIDGVTEEDVEEGCLNDDQIQAMWGQTLEEAQGAEYRRIVAWTEGVDLTWTAEEMAAVLYRAVCEDGGKEITEHDDLDGLLEV